GDPWWEPFGFVTDKDRFDVPALHIDSWYEIAVKETFFHFNLFRANAESPRGRDNQYIMISPTTHCLSEYTTDHTVVGSRDVGDPRKEYWSIYLKWFNHWLKDEDNDVLSMPKVQVYVMGKNQWRTGNEWPLAGTRFTKYYLHSKGSANSRMGDGVL